MRGDGPGRLTLLASTTSFSPRAWGWSGFSGSTPNWHSVLPTCVGMVPRPAARIAHCLVLPTCVGMVRRKNPRGAERWRSPHMRGDGPCWRRGRRCGMTFSPRAWGWSANFVPDKVLPNVLPTCVGMVRARAAGLARRPSSPHVRGDGPPPSPTAKGVTQFSPRAWGWSVPRVAIIGSAIVLPTCVGMVRKRLRWLARICRSPHVRGDGPWLEANPRRRKKFSPRAWGWSALRNTEDWPS